MTTKTEKTKVETVDVDLDEILGGAGAGNVMVADEKSKKPTVLSKARVDLTFLDKPEHDDDDDPDLDPDEDLDPDDLDNDDPDNDDPDNDDPDDKEPFNFDKDKNDKNKKGRPRTIVNVMKKLIDDGTLIPFDDDKKLEEYNEDDFRELIETNLAHHQEELAKELPKQFLDQLPDELKDAYQYVASGGKDIKGLFKALAASVEMQELDITKTNGQKEAIRAYLTATQWGTPEEIEDEIYSLEDKGDLEKKAKQFKPKLDAMQQQIVNDRLAKQQLAVKQRQEASQKYVDSVYATLEKGELNGLKLDNKIQNLLYAGLVQSNYPSITGKQTNMLGHLLEQYQWVKPRHDLIAEALWLLSDPDGYKKAIGRVSVKDANAKTLRTLKTEAEQKGKGTPDEEEEDKGRGNRPVKTLNRQKRNFFSRT